MGWKKRFRELAERNPEAIPEWARRPATSKAWDRASWYLQADSDVTPELAARPIIFLLRWLAKKGELSPLGISALAKFPDSPATAVLDSTMVTRKGSQFLEQHYEDWHASDAINGMIDPSCDLDESSLDRRWAEFGRERREQGDADGSNLSKTDL